MGSKSAYDALIIGGGIIGLSIARALRQRGVSNLAVVERSACGEEASWAAAGMLVPQAETDVADAFFDLCAASRDLYPSFAAALEEETGIDIELDRTGTLYLAFSDEDARHLHARWEWQTAAGLRVERLTAQQARQEEPFASPNVKGALLFPDDWQVDNRQALAALRRYAELNDITLLEHTSVEALETDGGRTTGVRTAGGSIKAERVIIAAGAWTSFIRIGDVGMPVKVDPVKGQMISYRTAKRLFRHVIYSHRGYIVPRADGRVLVGSTTERAGFDKSVTGMAVDRLRNVAAEISLSLGALEISEQWAGLRPYAADGLPILGGIAGIEGLTIATAHYRNGILLAPITAELIAEKVVNNADAPAFVTFGTDRLRFAATNG